MYFTLLPSYVMVRVTFNVIQLLYRGKKAEQYFVRLSCTFLYRKLLLKVWLKPGLNLTVFRGTGPGEKNKNKNKKYMAENSYNRRQNELRHFAQNWAFLRFINESSVAQKSEYPI